MWRCLAIQELFDNDSSRCMWRLSWCDYDLVGSRDDDRGSQSAFGEVLSWCLTLLTTVRSVYDDYVYSEFLYLSAWFLLEFMSLPFESITALDARLISDSGYCAFNLHWLIWLWAPGCTDYLLNRGVIISSSDFSIPFFCQVERLVSSLGHPALLKESYKIWPCLATSAYIYLANDCVMYKQGVIRLMIILPPELIHDPMIVRMVYHVLCPLTLYFSQNLSR